MHDLHVAARSDVLAQHGNKTIVDLDCGNSCSRFGERERERTEPGANLEYMVALADAGERSNSPNSLRFDNEVLPEHSPRSQAVSGEQLRCLRAGERHQLIETGIGAFTRSESSTNSRVCKTMLTFAGVEGIITLEHAIERPLFKFFTTSVAP